jgi:hypothetical protein
MRWFYQHAMRIIVNLQLGIISQDEKLEIEANLKNKLVKDAI